MSVVEKLEEAIRMLGAICFHTQYEKSLLDNLKKEFVAFKKQCVCIPRKQLMDKYRKLCETRIHNIADDAVCFFIEELTDSEPEELLGVEKTK